VLFETKKPGNRAEMPSGDNISCKAFYELILYYLRERLTQRNIAIKYLVITDIYEWYIFSTSDFEKLFVSDKKLVHDFTEFEEGRMASSNTEFFYNSIAAPFVAESSEEIPVTRFDIRDYETLIKNNDKSDDSKLITLYKILSPEHLLKLSFTNDSNSLDKSFYSELLHIIGLEETKQGSRKIIGRKKEERRNPASLIENSITILRSEDCLRQIPGLTDYGNTTDEQLFNVSLELAITWINRILFLKLLEGQLIKYNEGDKSFKFLDAGRVNDFDELNKLFFQVLAIKEPERSSSVRKKYSGIPYLNSSLFEPSELERRTIKISSLDNDAQLPYPGSTVLKDQKGRKKTGSAGTLEYLFGFLDAYDFSGEGSEEIQEENKTLINASVLGLIFEKINGYKDGSFFTPGFITMYMCHETITRAVVQKFNDAKGWNCKSIAGLYNKITDITEANRLINSLKICDPAVGSGHFLVSALNEIIAIKSELGILADKQGKKLKDYNVEVVNDELVITGENGEFLEYNPRNRESQRVQETLFHEKQTIIENCLFGVDINPNSVKICRLRLWIELLKNAYYKTPLTTNRVPQAELETLPNIDINIKCGNSLISRYPLDADIKTALKSSRWSVDSYRDAVMTYRNAGSKEVKRTMEELITKIKGDFEAEVSKSDKRFLKLNRLKGELVGMSGQGALFDMPKKEKDEWNKKVNKLTEEISKLDAEIAAIKSNKIYEKAFEWRFEFPEVLNDDGDFVGFDVVIGNPPYIPLENIEPSERVLLSEKYRIFERKYDSSVMFFAEGFTKLRNKGLISFIAPITWQTGENYNQFRKWIIEDKGILEIINLPFDIFEDAYVETAIYCLINSPVSSYKIFSFDKKVKEVNLSNLIFSVIPADLILPPKYKVVLNPLVNKIITRITNDDFTKLGEISISTQGLSGKVFREPLETDKFIYQILRKGNVYNYQLKVEETSTISLDDHSSLRRYYEAEPKILIRRIISRQNRLSVAYTEDKLVFKKDINPFIITNENFATKFVLGILASKLMSFLYINLSSIATKDDFRQTTLSEIRELPIPKIRLEEQEILINAVNKILNIRRDDSNSDTSVLELEIDNYVFKLFNLTPEEIRIVEEG
jgi:adenine-specific DNA-methyltransferase